MSRRRARAEPAVRKIEGGAGEQELSVGPDMIVSLSYRLYDHAGKLSDTVPRAEPLSYLHGHAQIIPGLEAGVEGAKLHEKRRFQVSPESAFGARDESALLEIDRADFPGGETATPGDELVSTGPDGVEVPFRVIAVNEDTIEADLNHPLAGHRVRFEVEVCALRVATDEELDAAHAELDERLAGGVNIVYAGEPAKGGDVLAPGGSLIQLRGQRGKSDEGTA